MEDTTDLEDWEPFRHLRQPADDWHGRPGWRPERRYVIWYPVFDPPGLPERGSGQWADQ